MGVVLLDAFKRRFFLDLKNRDLDLQNLCSMLKISYAILPVYLN